MSICIAHYAKTPLMRALDDVRYAKKNNNTTQHPRARRWTKEGINVAA